MELKSEFKAIYNPYTRELLVRYGDSLIFHQFTDIEEWVCINYNDDANQDYYLHVQLDYDENFQLLFYPRMAGDESLNETYGSYYQSNRIENPKNIVLVHTDRQWDEMLVSFLEASKQELLNERKIKY